MFSYNVIPHINVSIVNVRSLMVRWDHRVQTENGIYFHYGVMFLRAAPCPFGCTISGLIDFYPSFGAALWEKPLWISCLRNRYGSRDYEPGTTNPTSRILGELRAKLTKKITHPWLVLITNQGRQSVTLNEIKILLYINMSWTWFFLVYCISTTIATT